MLNKEFLRLSYIVRPIAPPATFHNLTHELESVIVNDGSTAESRCDSKLVYSILYANTTDTAALSYIVRPIASPATFHTLTHKLESVIVNDGSTAQSKRDSRLVYSILYANTTDTAAKSYMEDGNELHCGRTAFGRRGLV